MRTIAVFSPAKINLSLAVTGRRDDGFHSLVSLVAPLRFGDELWLAFDPQAAGDVLDCDYPGVPTGPQNLVLQAARRFREGIDPDLPPIRILLKKRIPPAAGLGGGSSNAVAALRGMAMLSSRSVPDARLAGLATDLGSDCPLFLESGPVILRGRGEQVQPLSPAAGKRLGRYQLLLVKPPFGVETGWAYGQFARNELPFSDADRAERQLAAWQAGRISTGELMHNDFEQIVARKYLGLAAILEKLRAIAGLHCLLSGSGSAFFCLADEMAPLMLAQTLIGECLGDSSACIHTTFSSR